MKNLLLFLLSILLFSSCVEENKQKNKGETAIVPIEKPTIAEEKTFTKQDTLLFEACKKGNLELVQQLLDQGANPDARGLGYANHDEKGKVKNSDQGWTALMAAAYYKYLAIMKLLIEKKANITAYNSIGYTALHYACQSNNAEAAKLLLSHQAENYDKTKVKSGIPLNWAINYEDENLANLLIDKGEDLNYTSNETGRNNLIDAFYNKLPNVGIKMIKKGADVNLLSLKDKESPLMWAAKYNYIDAVKLLLLHDAAVNAVSKSYYTALAFAASNEFDDVSIATMLVAKGATINPPNEQGRTALIEAAGSGNIKIVKFLLDKGANPNQQAKFFGYISPLREAVFDCNFAITKLFVEHGSDVNLLTENGSSILLEAVWNEKNLDLVKYLIDKGALVNKANRDGETPILKSISSNHPKMIKLLMDNGADIHVTDGYNRNAISLAKERNDAALLNLVKGYY